MTDSLTMILEAAAAAPEGIKLKFSSKSQAETVRAQLYNQRRSDRAESKRAHKNTDPQYDRSDWDNLKLVIVETEEFQHELIITQDPLAAKGIELEITDIASGEKISLD